jgi:hypothetical protein
LLSQLLREIVGLRGVTNGHYFRPVPLDLSDQFVKIRTRGQCHHAKSPGQRLHDRQALPPD